MKDVVKENRIIDVFRKGAGKLLSVYYTAGYPTVRDTVRIGKLLESSGADIIEIGIPFSDPVADGPVIQASSKVALENGMTLKVLLDQVKELRRDIDTPIILMGYFNPVLQFGVEEFCEAASAAGVDGLIIPDLPLAEFQQLYRDVFMRNGLQNIFLVSPTTSDTRIKQIDDLTEGFIYAVSASSTTGAKNDFSAAQQSYFQRLNDLKLKNPFLIGFGISNRETFELASKYSSGAIVGSAFISMLERSKDFETDIPLFVKNLKG